MKNTSTFSAPRSNGVRRGNFNLWVLLSLLLGVYSVAAAQGFNVKINFQPTSAAVPGGYLADTGEVFGNRGNGYTYGWNANCSAYTRERNAANSPDKRYDTLVHTQLYGIFVWEIAVPNGMYSVHLVAGDPLGADSVYKVTAEGALTVDGTPTSAVHWIEGTQTVTVSDGRLTIDNAPGASNNKLCFVEISAVGLSGNVPPATPVITQPSSDGTIAHPADVHMETAAFSDPNPGDTHICTDWEIWTISPAEPVWVSSCNSAQKVHVHLADGIFVNSYAGRTELNYDTDYRLRVRFRDSSGDPATEWSAWAERLFRTTSAPPTGGPITWTVRQSGFQVEVFATGFELPVNIAFLPNPGSNPTDAYFYVTELYGQIKVVRRDGTISDYIRGVLNYRPSGAFPGSGEQGLTGIVVDPASGDVFASMLYDPGPAGGGSKYAKVVRFRSNENGTIAGSNTTILDMVGEPMSESHQISNLSIGPDGKLYVHMGDGFDTATAQNLNSFRGKILRLNLDGSPAVDNPFYNASDGITAKDYVYAYGFRNPFGGAWRAADNFHYEVENGPSVDRFAKVVSGRNYLWDGSDASMSNFAIYNWSPAVAPVNIAFIQPETFNGSGFPTGKMGHAFVTESGPTWATGPQGVSGKRISEFVLDANGNRVSGPTPLIEYTGTGKATASGLAAGPDGLYFTDLYVDQNFSTAVARGANVLRIKAVAIQPAPAAPSGLSAATASSSQINLSWTDNSMNEDGFRIERKTGSGGTYAQIATVAAGTTTYQNTGLTPSTQYFYRVRAYNSGGDSNYSNEANATTTPAAPANLTAAVGNAQVSLSWAASSGAASYNIKRSTASGGPYTTIASGVTATSYPDSSVANGTTYYYVVSAVNSGGESANSNQVSATPLAAPNAPTNLTADNKAKRKITLRWTQSSSAGVTQNRVYRSTTNGGPYSLIATISATTSYTDASVSSGVTYYYVVAAVNSNGTLSANSNQVSVIAK